MSVHLIKVTMKPTKYGHRLYVRSIAAHWPTLKRLFSEPKKNCSKEYQYIVVITNAQTLPNKLLSKCHPTQKPKQSHFTRLPVPLAHFSRNPRLGRCCNGTKFIFHLNSTRPPVPLALVCFSRNPRSSNQS